MGTGYVCKCNKCGYEFHANLGIGFRFPEVYQNTVKAMKAGEYGEQGKEFFEEHPDGAISCENVVAKCSNCGKFDRVPDLTMYVPKPGVTEKADASKGGWSVAFPYEDTEYVTWLDLEKDYIEFERFDHRCPDCGKSVEIIPDFEDKIETGKLCCPKCDSVMELAEMIMWD